MSSPDNPNQKDPYAKNNSDWSMSDARKWREVAELEKSIKILEDFRRNTRIKNFLQKGEHVVAMMEPGAKEEIEILFNGSSLEEAQRVCQEALEDFYLLLEEREKEHGDEFDRNDYYKPTVISP